MSVEKLQKKIIEEFGSNATQADFSKKVDRGLWNSEKLLIEEFFRPKTTILDIGCGTGRTTIPLYKLGYAVLGIDIVPEMIENAKKIAQEKGLDINYEVGDATSLKYPDNSFDNAIFSNNGFGQIPGKRKRQKAIEEIYRVLKPGGYFILFAHARVKGDVGWFWIKNFVKIYILKKLGFNVEEIDFGDYIFQRYINGIKIGQTQFMHIANEKAIIEDIKRTGFDLVFSKREDKITEHDVHDRDNVYNHPPVCFVCQK